MSDAKLCRRCGVAYERPWPDFITPSGPLVRCPACSCPSDPPMNAMPSRCCDHPVERHAYNGCADCGCGVRWTEHPDRDSDQSDSAKAARAFDEARRLVDDIVNVTGDLVDERRLSIAQTYLDTWQRSAEERERLIDRQALHITHLVMEKRGHDWFAEILVLREQRDLALKMRDAAREASSRDLETRRKATSEVARLQGIIAATFDAIDAWRKS